MAVAFITGITGQDGSYLAEFLLSKGYTVHGSVRRTSSIERSRLKQLFSDTNVYNHTLFLHYAELEDVTNLRRLLLKIEPDEFYHLAGQSHVGLSFEIPESTCEQTAMSTLRILEIIRDSPFAFPCRGIAYVPPSLDVTFRRTGRGEGGSPGGPCRLPGTGPHRSGRRCKVFLE